MTVSPQLIRSFCLAESSDRNLIPCLMMDCMQFVSFCSFSLASNVSVCFWVGVCLHASCVLFLRVYWSWMCKTGSTGLVWSVIDCYISADYYSWVVGMDIQGCALPEERITPHRAALQPCRNGLVTGYRCCNTLIMLFYGFCCVLSHGQRTNPMSPLLLEHPYLNLN